DGNLWFTEAAAQRIGRITPGGTITDFLLASTRGMPQEITVGPDGNLWIVEYIVVLPSTTGLIARFTPSGSLTEYEVGAFGGITPGPGGALWFTERGVALGSITPSGQPTEFAPFAGTFGQQPGKVTIGPDGALWFTVEAQEQSWIGRAMP